MKVPHLQNHQSQRERELPKLGYKIDIFQCAQIQITFLGVSLKKKFQSFLFPMQVPTEWVMEPSSVYNIPQEPILLPPFLSLPQKSSDANRCQKGVLLMFQCTDLLVRQLPHLTPHYFQWFLFPVVRDKTTSGFSQKCEHSQSSCVKIM